MIYKAWVMCDRFDKNYHATDLLSDVLGNGNSSRFYQKLIKDRKLFSELDAYVTGSLDPGMFVVAGKLSAGVSLEEADAAISQEISLLHTALIDPIELQKVKIKLKHIWYIRGSMC